MSETNEGGNSELNRMDKARGEHGDTRFPWLEWKLLVGGREPKGSRAHAYDRRVNRALCGAEPEMAGAPVYPRVRIAGEGMHVLDERCPDCLAEAERRWGEAEPETASPERRRPSPRIYVASLADYNASELLGTWIDADQDSEQLRAGIEAMLAGSDQEAAEEWAIHDYEGFGPFQVHEYESLETISAVGNGIAEHGPAFAAYVSWAGTDEEALGAFSDHYMGSWPSLDAYARELAEDFGWERALKELPEDMRQYVSIDYDGLARLAETAMNIVAYDHAIYVFNER